MHVSHPVADDLLELSIGPPAHGGHCVARHDGRVVFVRHTLPGERVQARVTHRTRRYWHAEAVRVLQPSPDRVPSIWPEAGPGGVGGGELAHVALPAQREWKRTVVLDTLRRIGGVDRDHRALQDFRVQHVPVPGHPAHDDDGTGYRTRISVQADDDGRPGMRRYRSDQVVPLQDLPLAHPAAQDLDLLGRTWAPGARVQAIVSATGDAVVLQDGTPVQAGRTRVREVVHHDGQTFRYRVSAGGFWQAHAGAPAVLVRAVTGAAALGTGQHAVELYSGAGLLTTPLAHAVGSGGRVDAVEGSPTGARDARRNAHGHPQVHLHHADVRAYLDAAPHRPDVVVLDPPRTGAGREVMQRVAGMAPERIVYVACDPAALARDLATARSTGYHLAALSGFDLFPHTHHVECVAVLERTPGD